MLEKLNDISYCSKQSDSNNIKLLIDLTPSNESNKINFACINLLINKKTIDALLVLNIVHLENILNALPSQIRTLLCLDKFNAMMANSLKTNPGGHQQYEMIKKFDYKKQSEYLKMISYIPTSNNVSMVQTVFDF